jgi:hypothetical protein
VFDQTEDLPMAIRWRPMDLKDVRECAEIVAAHPVIGPRYASALPKLRPAWSSLVGSEAAIMVVFEAIEGSRSVICGVGVAVFVHDEFLRELKKRPFWIGPELAKRIVGGKSPVLSDKQFREANSSCGLNHVTWEGIVRPDFEENSELRRKLPTALIAEHRGLFLNEAIANQMDSNERLRWTLEVGALLWDPAAGRYVERFPKDPHELIRNPHVVGISREAETRRTGTWVGALFDYTPPRCGFSTAERQLLSAALTGAIDQELSTKLSISMSTIKKNWGSIYRRAASSLPDVFLDNSPPVAGTGERGKEKRRYLLAYLREHPEELRPQSRKRRPARSR